MEIEAKYRVVGPLDIAQIEAIDFAPCAMTFDASLDLRDEVYDTSTLALAAAGNALRVRRDGRRVIVTLKSAGRVEGSVHVREEIEVDATEAAVEAGHWPEEVRRRVDEVAKGQLLAPVVAVENHRRTWSLTAGDRSIAELALDEGTIRAEGRERPFLEVEVELKGDGNREDLDRITRILVANLPLEPEPKSKFARGLALISPGAPALSPAPVPARAFDAPGAEPATRWDFASGRSPLEALLAAEALAQDTRLAATAPAPASIPAAVPSPATAGPRAAAPSTPVARPAPVEATAGPNPRSADEPAPDGGAESPGGPARRSILQTAGTIVGRNLERLIAAEPIAREGLDPEGVHDMRVATRRMRAALKILVESGRTGGGVLRLHDALSALASTLGAVRDADVLLMELDGYAANHTREEVAGLGPLRAELELQRAKGRKQMLMVLNAKATRRLLRDTNRWVRRAERPTDFRGGVPKPIWARHFAHSALWRRYEEILAYETAMPAPIPLLHRLRIAGKRFRYSLEFFEDALGPDTRGLLRQLAATQDRLGELNDAEVAIQLIDGLARQRLGTAALQSYRDFCRTRQDELAAAFSTDWATLTGREFRGRLSELLADL